MLSVTQQCDRVSLAIPERVRQLGLSLMTFHKQRFPFPMITPSVHQMCAHLWELFQMTEE